jgi:hypothetical protein
MGLIATQEPGRGPETPSSTEAEAGVEGDPREAMPELAAMEQSLQQYSDDAKAPPETVALYLAACADAELAVATLEQAKAAITYHHDEAALASPCASVVVKKLQRRL